MDVHSMGSAVVVGYLQHAVQVGSGRRQVEG